MDAQTGELLKNIGLIGLTLFIVLLAFRRLSDNLSEVIKANSDAQKSSAATLQSLINYLNAYTGRLEQIQKSFDDHTKSETEASKEEAEAQKKFVDALTANTKTLTEMQTTTLSQLNSAMSEMRIAQRMIVEGINANTDKRAGETGDQIVGSEDKLTKQYAEQTGELTKKMNGIQRTLDQFGKDTAEKIDSVLSKLEEMTGTLEGLRQDMLTIKTQAKSEEERKEALDAFSLKVDGLVSAVNRLTADLAPKDRPDVISEVHLAIDAGERGTATSIPVPPKEETK